MCPVQAAKGRGKHLAPGRDGYVNFVFNFGNPTSFVKEALATWRRCEAHHTWPLCVHVVDIHALRTIGVLQECFAHFHIYFLALRSTRDSAA